MQPEFVPFPKLPRLSRRCAITEKIDGTNAQVVITPEGDVLAGRRTDWCTIGHDNYGFAAWVEAHKEELKGLGEGRHFGEWWGAGIGRRYGLKEKRFSLFNTGRWCAPGVVLPACVSTVPVLYEGPFLTSAIDECVERLRRDGSVAAPGFMQPEGVVVFHSAAGVSFKKTLEKDEKHKGEA